MSFKKEEKVSNQLQERILEEKRQKRWTVAIWVLIYIVAVVLCFQINYSDGDDAFFKELTNTRGLFDYVKWRYITWEGRATSEAMTWIGFHMSLNVWRFFNAFVITMLPLGLVHIASKMSKRPFRTKELLNYSAVTCISMVLMDIMVIGYGAFWITGSTFYLWSIVSGIWALVPIAELVFRGSCRKRTFIYSIPLAFIASMGMEQIAAVGIVFGCLGCLYHLVKQRKMPIGVTIQTVVMIVGLILLFISPGTTARGDQEIVNWMPQYATMSVGTHIFITVQWLVSSLANESAAYFLMIWFLLFFILWQKGTKKKWWSIAAIILVAADVFRFAGIAWFSEMGVGVEDITQTVTEVATWQTTTLQNHFALIWWIVAVLLTLVLLWNATEDLRLRITQELIFLGGLASSAIMYFSPTMYASGARVWFMMNIMFWFVLLLLFGQLKEKKYFRIAFVLLIAVAILQLGTEAENLLVVLQSQ